ncbi:thioredoxin domain-containing protein [Myroides sp. WP-1]|uniref:thioredoxin domain-containing protein n=1 Tax=Myroides sp. WP-1 TaxID=2759944 RepID=UPI0015FBD655|nr:thioredoxin domain-containing protein [Myroides sp. WP-1]MBB1138346.1 thioredoxin domain-containing protein [Myroides sp. WP-1]
MNELIYTSNPYLKQHATNPIHWKAWSNSVFEKAKKLNQLVVVSIGYSTCHWCHVMEDESFTNLEVAEVMNRDFLSIKVDREEHPDVDAYYMKAVQLMTKQGGWPLNVVCLPDGRPIWGGTYFPKQTWLDALTQLAQLHQDKPETVLEFATKLQEGVYIMGLAPSVNEERRFNLDVLLEKWKQSFDLEYGGYQRAPKFMMPTNLLYLQKLGDLTRDKDLLHYIDLTLTQMAWGGIFDVIEGGFSRYSVDFKWHIPHFEKMLYDNAQLLSVYSDGYKRTANPLYLEIIDKTVTFIQRNWQSDWGGVYSALDADSLDVHGASKEGAYYVWTEAELRRILGDDFSLFAQVFNINDYGYWEEENFVLIQNQTLEAIASANQVDIFDLQERKKRWEHLLLQERVQRSKPLLDDKIICSWNAMLITGLVDSYSATGNPSYLKQAEHINHYIQNYLLDEEQGLFHSSHQQQAQTLGYLDDYSFYIQALIRLFEHTANQAYLWQAKRLMDLTLDLFLDEKSKFFYFSQVNQAGNILRSIETEDNVIPSANAVLCMSLLQLGIAFEHSYYTQLAHNMIEVMQSNLDYPSAYSHWLLTMLYTESPAELTIVGTNALEESLKIQANLISKTFIFPVTQASSIPYFEKYTIDSTTQYYLCENKHCLTPTTELSSLFKL